MIMQGIAGVDGDVALQSQAFARRALTPLLGA
jgi:hypothetical protein